MVFLWLRFHCGLLESHKYYWRPWAYKDGSTDYELQRRLYGCTEWASTLDTYVDYYLHIYKCKIIGRRPRYVDQDSSGMR
jgi:hypothetical protein